MKKYAILIAAAFLAFDILALAQRHSAKADAEAFWPVPDVTNPVPADEEPVPPVCPDPEFVTVKQIRNQTEQSYYGDVLSRSSRPLNIMINGRPASSKEINRATRAHETGHIIQADVRNAVIAATKRRVNAFYVLDGKAVVVEEPNVRMAQVHRFVPEKLRGEAKWKTYFVNAAKDWDDTALYICDEWSCYTLDAMVSVQDIKAKRHEGGNSDELGGCLEFSVYTLGLCMAIEKHDPDYWRDNDQFRRFVQFQLKRAATAYEAGKDLPELKWAAHDQLLHDFRTAPEAEPMRAFCRKHFGGVWLD